MQRQQAATWPRWEDHSRSSWQEDRSVDQWHWNKWSLRDGMIFFTAILIYTCANNANGSTLVPGDGASVGDAGDLENF